MSNNTQLENLKLGQKVLAVHRDYAFKNRPGGKVIGLKVTGFKNSSGKLLAVLQGNNSNVELTSEQYEIYTDVTSALEAIKS